MRRSFSTIDICLLKKTLSIVLILALMFPPGMVQAQPVSLPPLGTVLTATSKFNSINVKGLTVHPENPFQFEFIIDAADTASNESEGAIADEGFPQGDSLLRSESMKLIKYFLTTLTVPDNEMWVNLSPAEKDRIIADGLGQTVMGRDLLVQDYLLKQFTASLMNPETESGKKFWEKIYAGDSPLLKAGTVPVETFNKVWIVPSRASIYQHGTSAIIVDNRLTVMLEEDYLAAGVQRLADSQNQKLNPNPYSLTANRSNIKDIIRAEIIPIIEKEVNEGETFANLRQIYNAMLLATWYKRNLKKSLLAQVYVDRNKVQGVDSGDAQAIQNIYDQYVASFKAGAADLIKEEYDPETQQAVTRQYFTGGMEDYGQLAINPAHRVNLAQLVTPNDLSVSVLINDGEADDAMLLSSKMLTVTKNFNGEAWIKMHHGTTNPMSSDFLKDLLRVINELNQDDSVRTIVLTSGLEYFMAGADLKARQKMGKDAKEIRAAVVEINAVVEALANSPKRTAVILNGSAYGGGLELAMAADHRIMLRENSQGKTNRVGLTETTLGIIPGAGGTVRLPRLVGIARAKDMILKAKLIDAEEALAIGLVDGVVENIVEASVALKLVIQKNKRPEQKVWKAPEPQNIRYKISANIDPNGIAWVTLARHQNSQRLNVGTIKLVELRRNEKVKAIVVQATNEQFSWLAEAWPVLETFPKPTIAVMKDDIVSEEAKAVVEQFDFHLTFDGLNNSDALIDAAVYHSVEFKKQVEKIMQDLQGDRPFKKSGLPPYAYAAAKLAIVEGMKVSKDVALSWVQPALYGWTIPQPERLQALNTFLNDSRAPRVYSWGVEEMTRVLDYWLVREQLKNGSSNEIFNLKILPQDEVNVLKWEIDSKPNNLAMMSSNVAPSIYNYGKQIRGEALLIGDKKHTDHFLFEVFSNITGTKVKLKSKNPGFEYEIKAQGFQIKKMPMVEDLGRKLTYTISPFFYQKLEKAGFPLTFKIEGVEEAWGKVVEISFIQEIPQRKKIRGPILAPQPVPYPPNSAWSRNWDSILSLSSKNGFTTVSYDGKKIKIQGHHIKDIVDVRDRAKDFQVIVSPVLLKKMKADGVPLVINLGDGKQAQKIKFVQDPEWKNDSAMLFADEALLKIESITHAGLSPQHILFSNDMRRWVKENLSPERAVRIDSENNMMSGEMPEFRKALHRPIAPGGPRIVGIALGQEYQHSDYKGPLMGTMGDVIATMHIAAASQGPALTVDVDNDLTIFPVNLAASEAQKQKYLIPHLKGERKICYGLTEEKPGSDAIGSIRAVAEYDPETGEFAITGTKRYITNGAEADYVLVFAEVKVKGESETFGKLLNKGKRIGAFFVPTRIFEGEQEGQDHPLVQRPLIKVIGHRGTGTTQFFFNGVKVKADDVLGEIWINKDGKQRKELLTNKDLMLGSTIFLKTLEAGRISISSIALGSQLATLRELIKAYKELQEAGFNSDEWEQAINDLTADFNAGWRMIQRVSQLKEESKPYNLQAGILKLVTSEAAIRNTRRAMLLIGDEASRPGHPLERIHRDNKLLSIGEGSTQTMRGGVVINELKRRYGDWESSEIELLHRAINESYLIDEDQIGGIRSLFQQYENENDSELKEVVQWQIIDMYAVAAAVKILKEAKNTSESIVERYIQMFEQMPEYFQEYREFLKRPIARAKVDAISNDWLTYLRIEAIREALDREAIRDALDDGRVIGEKMSSEEIHGMISMLKENFVASTQLAADALWQEAEDYAKDRKKADGQAVFEYVQVRVILLQRVKKLIDAMSVDQDPEELAGALMEIGDHLLQVFGGAGYAGESHAGQFYMKAAVLAPMFISRMRELEALADNAMLQDVNYKTSKDLADDFAESVAESDIKLLHPDVRGEGAEIPRVIRENLSRYSMQRVLQIGVQYHVYRITSGPETTNDVQTVLYEIVDENLRVIQSKYYEGEDLVNLISELWRWALASEEGRQDLWQEIQELVSDGAMVVSPHHGGIDLDGSKLEIDIQGSGDAFEMKFDPAILEKFRSIEFKGFNPVILDIKPITATPLYSELTGEAPRQAADEADAGMDLSYLKED